MIYEYESMNYAMMRKIKNEYGMIIKNALMMVIMTEVR